MGRHKAEHLRRMPCFTAGSAFRSFSAGSACSDSRAMACSGRRRRDWTSRKMRRNKSWKIVKKTG